MWLLHPHSEGSQKRSKVGAAQSRTAQNWGRGRAEEGGYLTLPLQVFDGHGNQTWKETVAKLLKKKLPFLIFQIKNVRFVFLKWGGEWKVKEAFDLKNKEFMLQNPLEKKKSQIYLVKATIFYSSLNF